MPEPRPLFCVRTITCFVNLSREDFDKDGVAETIAAAADVLRITKKKLQETWIVQTVRIATNPFGEWLLDPSQLATLDDILARNEIEFCSLGPATSIAQVRELCPQILQYQRMSCSADLKVNDVAFARVCAELILSQPDVLNNFRFCVACCAKEYIPFFPVAKAGSQGGLRFAIGLENGALAHDLLSQCQTLANVPTVFRRGMEDAIAPLRQACKSCEGGAFLGIDTSLNPSLDHEHGSVAQAMEQLDEVECFGGPGSVAAAAAITKVLQSIPDSCGYSGLMLPVCEDKRLAQLSEGKLSISHLLTISQVCGVGIDTVPIPVDTQPALLSSLLLDVAAQADRWNKSLSCRVFPYGKASEWTDFDSPYMVNARVIPL